MFDPDTFVRNLVSLTHLNLQIWAKLRRWYVRFLINPLEKKIVISPEPVMKLVPVTTLDNRNKTTSKNLTMMW